MFRRPCPRLSASGYARHLLWGFVAAPATLASLKKNSSDQMPLSISSPELLKQSSESLAGRLELVPVEGLRLSDLPSDAQECHWLRGGFPLSYTAKSDIASLVWRKQFLQLSPDEYYFWSTHRGAAIDLLLIKEGKRIGVEFKRVDAPKMTPSLRTSLEDLKLDHVQVVYPGEKFYPITERIDAIPLSALISKSVDKPL